MTSALQEYLMGVYRNPNPCKHIIKRLGNLFTGTGDITYYCEVCNCVAVVREIELMMNPNRRYSPKLVWKRRTS